MHGHENKMQIITDQLLIENKSLFVGCSQTSISLTNNKGIILLLYS